MSIVTVLTRLPDWPARLSALVAAAHVQPFAWGTHDCCLWAADAVLALTGTDPAAGLRGRYSQVQGAHRLLAAHGGLRGVVQRHCPALPTPHQAWEGDVGLVHVDRPMLAVRVADVWLCAATRGLHAVPAAAASMAWGVGHA